MNNPVCIECGVEVNEKTHTQCWTDKYTPDHHGLCCDCFDTSLGAPAKVKLNAPKTATDWFRYEDEKN